MPGRVGYRAARKAGGRLKKVISRTPSKKKTAPQKLKTTAPLKAKRAIKLNTLSTMKKKSASFGQISNKELTQMLKKKKIRRRR